MLMVVMEEQMRLYQEDNILVLEEGEGEDWFFVQPMHLVLLTSMF